MPPYESAIILGNLMSGGILLDEFKAYSTEQLLFIFLGSSINIVGIFFKLFVMPSELNIKEEIAQSLPDTRFRALTLNQNDSTQEFKEMIQYI
jgi:hypothetical protein